MKKKLSYSKKVEELISNYLFNDDYTVKDSFSTNDILYESDDKVIIAEIKVRYNKTTDYPDWIYEEKKHKSLIKKAIESYNNNKDKQHGVYYINYFKGDNTLVIWNIKDLFKNKKRKIHYSHYNKTTTFGNTNKIRKGVFKLKLNEAEKIINKINL